MSPAYIAAAIVNANVWLAEGHTLAGVLWIAVSLLMMLLRYCQMVDNPREKQ